MSLLQGRSFVALSIVAASSMSVAFAKQVNVSTVAALTSATLNAKAGDTIWVAPGMYELPSSNCQKDTFVNNTGRDCGRIWLGADGTKNNPIVLAGSDPANPPEIYGTAVNSNYGIHVTGNYVILKNLKIHTFSKGVVFDNSVGALMEDCEVYHTGTELVHVRDSSQQVTLNRNFIHGSGYETPRYGEGIYVGTYFKSWASSQQSDKTAGFWGADASQHRYSGYDWRVNDTKITCNIVKATTAENIDVKEGTIRGTVQGNMFIADSTNYDGQVDYDDANIDMKGASWSVTGNYFYNSKKSGLPYYNSHFRYFVEEVVMPSDGNKANSNIGKYETAVGYPVTADRYAQNGWCDNSGTDKNDCVESKNHVVEEIVDVRNDCAELFKIPSSSIGYSSSFTPPSSSSVNPPSSSSVISSSGSTSYETARYEAEDATCTGTGCETKSHKDASGGKYVLTKNDGNITFNVNVPTAGTYTVTIRYNNSASNAKTQDIYVNGTKVKSQEFPVTLEGDVGGANAAFEDMPVQVSLKAGANTFAINKSWGYVDIDYIEVKVPLPSTSSSSSQPLSSAVEQSSSSVTQSSSSDNPPSSSSDNPSSSSSVTSSSESISYETVRYEAEDATCAGTGCETKSHKDASGGKYVLTKNDGNITFNINVPTAGTYTVTIRYNNSANNAKTQDIYVNETKVKSQEFPVTLEGNVGGANAAFEDMPVQVSLKAGANTFAINKSWGYVDIDYIAIDVPVSSETTFQTVRYEAEDASCVGSKCETKSHKDASGGKYVLPKNEGDITFNIDVPTAGKYDILIRYNNSANNAKTQHVLVNGVQVMNVEFPVTLPGNVGGANAVFADTTITFSLMAGANTFAITTFWGYVDIDYIEVAVPNQNGPMSSSATSPTTSSSVQPASSASAMANPSIAANVPLFRAYAAGKSIHLEGVQPGQAFAVLDMQGRVLRSGRVPASGLSVRVDRPGVYLVKVGTSVRTVKVH